MYKIFKKGVRTRQRREDTRKVRDAIKRFIAKHKAVSTGAVNEFIRVELKKDYNNWYGFLKELEYFGIIERVPAHFIWKGEGKRRPK